LSSPSIKLNPDYVSAERDIEIFDPKKNTIIMNIEEGMK